MPGDGTRTATTNADPLRRCLDLTRLISRVGKGPDTGVDRVERAYLMRLLTEPLPVFGLVRTPLGYILLDRNGMRQVAHRLSGAVAWGRVDLIGILSRKTPRMRRRAQADLRRLAIARCLTGRLHAMLRRRFPSGCHYINVGHSNLRYDVLAAWRNLKGGRIAVLVHDTIPLDYPQFQRPGTPELFMAKLRRVSAMADLVICNSQVTSDDAQRWFREFGRKPDCVVAHLGVDIPQADLADLPSDVDLSKPYFLTIGTIEPRKNHALLLDVWEKIVAELPQSHAPHLIIVGKRGWANEPVFHRLDTSALMNRVIFERAGLKDNALAALLAGSSGLLCPSFAEGFGLPPVEAAALGVPVICRRLPVYEEILGNIPVYLDSDDVYLWKQSIMRLTEAKAARQQRGNQAKAPTKTPNWDDHFNIVLKLT